MTGCECPPGFYDAGCTNLNECLNETICGDHATCVDLPGSFRCDCVDGYFYMNEDNTTCVGR